VTLRTRVLLAVGVIGLMVVATAFITTRIARDRLVDQVDERLATAVPGLRGLGPRGDAPVGGLPRFNPYYVGVVVDGQIVDRLVPNLTGTEAKPPEIAPDDVVEHARSGAPFTASDADGDLDYRVVVREDRRDADLVVIGAPLDQVDASVAEIGRVSGIIALIVLASLGLVTWWVLRLGVRPVRRITRVAADIDHGDLTQRVPGANPNTEVGQLATTLNSMLDRIEGAFSEREATDARLRRFVGDASHELRTPVQTIRGYAELYRIGGLDGPNQLEDAMVRTEAEAARMGSLVDELLTLARFDQERAIDVIDVDLAQLARDAAADARAIQPKRVVEIDAPDSAIVAGDEHHLRQVFANIVNNSLSHTPVSSPIRITVTPATTADGLTTVIVRDEGPGMTPDEVERAFERFFRADPARTRANGGSGLGLAIVESAVGAHGGSIWLESSAAGGTTITFTIPRRLQS
jgi:two-component system, OmpR family, sensor kinase